MHMVLKSLGSRARTRPTFAARPGTLHYSTIGFQDVAVQKIEKKNDSLFAVTDANGKAWTFREHILAIGSSDVFPAIEGYAPLWGTRIFHCLFCKGYEDRGAPSAGVLAVPPVPGLPVDMLVGLAIHAATSRFHVPQEVLQDGSPTATQMHPNSAIVSPSTPTEMPH